MTCGHPGCGRAIRTRGHCQKHYLRLWRHGTTYTRERQHGVPAPERFWSHVDVRGLDECWPFDPPGADGYGRFNVDAAGSSTLAHRYAWELLIGPLAPGELLDHRCHVPDGSCAGGPTCPHRACVNVIMHVETESNRENCLRGQAPSIRAARNDLCMSGRHRPSEVGWRQMNHGRWCAACADEYDLARNARNRASRRLGR